MIRKILFSVIVSVAVLAVGSVANAQMGELRGHVFLKAADGTKTPIEGAVIDIYRTDVAGKAQIKSHKDGSFVHAGLPFVGTYLLAVSAPGASPKTQSDVKVGHGAVYDIDLDPGEGKVLTEAEAKTAAASAPAAPNGKETAEQKAAREAAEAKNAALKAEHDKAVNANEGVIGAYKAGNDLYLEARKASTAKQYKEAIAKHDQAIAKYDEGINIDPTHPGIPSLLTNKSLSLTDRGVSQHNVAATSTDPAEKAAATEASKKDLTSAVETAEKAVQLLVNGTDEIKSGPNFAANKLFALGARAQAYRWLVALSDPSRASDGVKAYEEYVAAETDPAKQATGQMELAKMLFDAGDVDRAIVSYQKILTDKPDAIDAEYWLGIALITAGEGSSDKAKTEQGVGYLQEFAEKADASDPRKSEVDGIVKQYVADKNFKPAKPPAGRTGTGKRKGA